MFRNLGCKVNLVNTREQAARVPRRRDHRRPELSPARPRRADPPQRGVRADRRAATTAWSCTSRAARSSRPTSCCGPTAAPATPTTWAWKASGITPDSRGQIAGRTSTIRPTVPHIYAVGDVIGYPVAGQRGLRAGPGRRPAHHRATQCDRAAGQRHSHRHLHQPRDQLASARPSAS